MPDIYVDGLHGVDYTSLRYPCPPKLVVNLFRHELHAPAVGGNCQISNFRVQHRPPLHEFVKPFFRIRVVQQRPVPAMPGALELLIDGGREIHHHAPLREHTAIVLLDHRAAAGGKHDGRQARETFYGFLLTRPEPGLALLLEDERDIHARLCLDVRVAIVKGESQHARQMPPHGGLAGAHGPDEEDVALGEHEVAAYRNEAAARRRPFVLKSSPCGPVNSTSRKWGIPMRSWCRAMSP